MRMHADLRRRDLVGELMDDPALDADQHRAALHGLARINRFSRSADLVWGAIQPFIEQSNGHPLRILDIATGGGDVPIQLLQLARAADVQLQITGCDISPTALDVARSRAADAPINWRQCDVLNQPLPDGFDVITSNLFLHHLTDDQVVDLLSRMAASARLGVIINDLRRSPIAYVWACLACRLLTRSRIVHVDGPLSIRAAFTLNEVRTLARHAGLTGAIIQPLRHWRWVMRWQREVRSEP